jgi:DNA-binding XRE family transcriptional regulator
VSEARDLVRTVAANVRTLRVAGGFTLPGLAERSGLGRSTLAQLETGAANPSIETLWAVAAALGVPFGRLIEPAGAAVRVVRKGGGVRTMTESGDWVVHLLGGRSARGPFELYVMDAVAGTARAAEAHGAGCVEHVYVVSGRLRCGPLGDEVDLAAGDLMTFPGDLPHRYEPLTNKARALLVMDYA